jgi:homopolymeric O-antigen transport system permease protein
MQAESTTERRAEVPASADPSGTREPPPIRVIEPRSGWIAIDWRELWDHRELLAFLTMRDIKVRYKQTVLGVAWAVIQPVLSMIIFSVIFGQLAKISSEGMPYPLFVYAGLLPWTFFSNATAQAALSLANQEALLTKVYLPRMFVPAAPVGGALVDLSISFGVFASLMLWYGVAPGPGLLVLPLLVVLTVAASLGVGLLLSALTVSYRDFRYVIPFAMQAWLYVTPVIYPVSVVPERYRWLIALNPLAGIIDGYRSALLSRPFDWATLGISAAVTAAVLMLGMYYFRKTERRFADIA